MPPNSQKQWMIKDATGRIEGPFNTEQVLEQIDRNYFLGEEQVATYPGGSWFHISRTPEFYDRLLDALANEGKAQGKTPPPGREAADDGSYDDDETPPPVPRRPSATTKSTTTPTAESTHSFNRPPRVEHTSASLRPIVGNSDERATSGGSDFSHGQNAVIELADLKQLERNEKIKQSKKPLLLIAVAMIIGLGAYLLSGPEQSGDRRIHLLSPHKGQSEISDAKQKEKMKVAVNGLVSDTFSGYILAQNELVEMIEGASPRPEDGMKKAYALSTLCLVYRELWAFAYQDSQDLKAIAGVTEEAKRIDPAGVNGTTCEITRQLMTGKYRDAQGLAESLLLEQSQAPVLYEIRGDIYYFNQDYTNAAEYFSKARALWPAWKKTFVQEARARARTQSYPAALELYAEVNKKIPSHGVAKIEMGIIEGLQFNQFDKSIQLIQSGLNSSDRVPRSIQSAGYLGLAQVYLRKNQKPKALENAQKAYALNSGNLEAKQMIVALAGEGELKNTKFKADELVSLGDQYARAGDCFSAQAQFKAAYDSDNKNAIAAMKAGKCLWQLNQTNEAIEWLRKAVLADPQLISAYVELADELAQRFDFYGASEILKKAQQRAPRSYEVYRGFAQIELRRNNFKGAISHGMRALQLYETDSPTLLIMAKANLGLQNFPEAQRFAARAIELDSNNHEAQIVYAQIEVGLHGVDTGANYLQQLIDRFVISKGQQIPVGAIEFREALGEIYLQDERYPAAEDVLRQAIALDPNSKKSLITLAKTMQAQSRNQEALELFLKAAVLDPSDADPIYFSGQLYLDAGKVSEASKQYERVLKINPRYPKGHSQLGRVYLRLGEPKRALEEAMAERATNPDLVESYLVAAESYFALKQYTSCAAEYQKAVSKHVKGTTLLVRMARCYRLAGALDSATSLLREAVTMESGNPDIYKEQGAIYHMKGMADDAITNYDTYLRLAPNAADRGEVESRIKRVQAGDMNVGDPQN